MAGAREGEVPGLGLPVVTATEPADAGTPEQGLPTGVYSPAFCMNATHGVCV